VWRFLRTLIETVEAEKLMSAQQETENLDEAEEFKTLEDE
jgi:hypothetical protein